MKNEKMMIYTTKDLYEAAALKASDCLYIGYDLQRKIYWFNFGDKVNTEKKVKQYWNYQLQVNAKSFSEAIRNLKEIIFANNK